LDTAIAAKDNKAASDLHEDCLDLITKLQWQLIDLQVVLAEADERQSVTELSNALEHLRVALNAPLSPNYLPGVREAMSRLGKDTSTVLDLLYTKASLKG